VTSPRSRFFDTFGFTVERGLLADRVAALSEAFEATVDPRARDEPRVLSVLDPAGPVAEAMLEGGVAAALDEVTGGEWQVVAADASRFYADTPWHRDGPHVVHRYVAVIAYLEPAGADGGALRVVPGSHTMAAFDRDWLTREEWGIEADEVPATVLETEPGDVILLDQNVAHATCHGGDGRRMLRLTVRCPVMAAGVPHAVPHAAPAAPKARETRVDVVADLDAITARLLGENITAMDLYTDAQPGLRRVGRIVTTPYPCLLVERAADEAATTPARAAPSP
jgi:hypothetical protein